MSSSKYTFLDFAEEVLKAVHKPMTFQEIWSTTIFYENIINDPDVYIKKMRSEK